MIRRTLLTSQAKPLITIDDIKLSLGLVGRTDRDPELETILSTAIGEVEVMGDISLSGYDVCVSYEYPNAVNSLYLHPVTGLVSVKSITGEDIPYTLHFDKRKFTLDIPQPCVVEYTTSALDEKQAQSYVNAVVELAMYIFNRETDSKTRNAILRPIASR